MTNATDIHMHVIPAVDDGSRNIDESCQMLRSAARQGIGTVFATPHSGAFDYCADRVHVSFEALKQAVKEREIPVALLLGCEMRCERYTVSRCVQMLNDGTYPTLGGSRCVLTEFDNRTDLQDGRQNGLYCVEQLINAGYTPVIAHVERYPYTDADWCRTLRMAGALLQINAYSIKNEHKPRILNTANALLKDRLVDFIGTDAHRTDHRPPLFSEGMNELIRLYTQQYAELIAVANPRRYLTENGEKQK